MLKFLNLKKKKNADTYSIIILPDCFYMNLYKIKLFGDGKIKEMGRIAVSYPTRASLKSVYIKILQTALDLTISHIYIAELHDNRRFKLHYILNNAFDIKEGIEKYVSDYYFNNVMYIYRIHNQVYKITDNIYIDVYSCLDIFTHKEFLSQSPLHKEFLSQNTLHSLTSLCNYNSKILNKSIDYNKLIERMNY